VRVNYMDILASRAKVALAMRVPSPQRALTIAPPPEAGAGSLPRLHQKLHALLGQLCVDGAVSAGVQVRVQRGSNPNP
jgi:hypothetical protein